MRVPSSTSGGRYARLLRSSTTVSSVRMGCRGGVRAGVGNHGHQVGDADVHAGLRQQRGCLAAVVGLVVEEVQQQRDEFARETVAARVGVTQYVPQVVVVQGRDPALSSEEPHV